MKNAANPKGEKGEQEEEHKDGEEEDAGGHIRVKDAHLPREVVLQLHHPDSFYPFFRRLQRDVYLG